MKHQFFGDPDSPLFGVHHPPRGIAPTTKRAVLICPPIGQEFVRTHWCLRLMANQLARNGSHVFRMDYAGIGDSSGYLRDVENTATWIENIGTAIDHLKKTSGAGTVLLVGLRFGALLAAEVARHRTDVCGMVAWEPVVNGADYLSELRAMHQRMLDLWVCKMTTPNNDQVEEILGSAYPRAVVQAIEQSENRFESVVQPQLIVTSKEEASNFFHPEPSVQKVIVADDEYSWNKLQALETAWLRSKTVREIVKQTDEMFRRLDRFDALQKPAIQTPSNSIGPAFPSMAMNTPEEALS